MEINAWAIAEEIKLLEQAQTPYDTGNAMNEGYGDVEHLVPQDAHYMINPDGASGPAPYMILLNEALIINYKGHLHTNIHYKWHDNALRNAVLLIANQIGGQVL